MRRSRIRRWVLAAVILLVMALSFTEIDALRWSNRWVGRAPQAFQGRTRTWSPYTWHVLRPWLGQSNAVREQVALELWDKGGITGSERRMAAWTVSMHWRGEELEGMGRAAALTLENRHIVLDSSIGGLRFQVALEGAEPVDGACASVLRLSVGEKSTAVKACTDLPAAPLKLGSCGSIGECTSGQLVELGRDSLYAFVMHWQVAYHGLHVFKVEGGKPRFLPDCAMAAIPRFVHYAEVSGYTYDAVSGYFIAPYDRFEPAGTYEVVAISDTCFGLAGQLKLDVGDGKGAPPLEEALQALRRWE